jgi:hypothetical protein
VELAAFVLIIPLGGWEFVFGGNTLDGDMAPKFSMLRLTAL